ncbi:MAG TPA: hypothetical protein VGM86_01535 [Thermoanaerobaculia bacterium]|jgi:hypothetical protein
MALKVGTRIWIPCDVKPGPFSDERFVKVCVNGGSAWLGFVPAYRLQEPILEGRTLLPALVVSITDDKFTARIPGEALTQTLFEGAVSRVQPVDSLQA